MSVMHTDRDVLDFFVVVVSGEQRQQNWIHVQFLCGQYLLNVQMVLLGFCCFCFCSLSSNEWLHK